MKITLNITPAFRNTTGIGTYARELASALLEIDRENNYTLFFSQKPFSRQSRLGLDFIKKAHSKLRTIDIPYRLLNFLWNRIGILPVEYLCGNCDVFHSLDMLSPIAKKAQILTTVHDLNWLVFDDNSISKKEALYKEVFKSLKRSKIIIADSNFTKKELLKYFPFLKDKVIEVVHLGVSDMFRPLDRAFIEDRKKKYGWGEFILYIGVLDQSRKNLIRLVKAYAILKKKGLIRERLVLCGRISSRSRKLLEVIDELKLKDDVIIKSNWIPDEDIPVLYNMAKVCAYPSLYEGFGLPILESMACGRPVITSELTGMPEVAGDAVYYIDPESVENIAKGLEEVLTDPGLYSRLSEKGLERAKRFTWYETARNTLEAYKNAFYNR